MRATAGHQPSDDRLSFIRKGGMDVGVRRPPGTFNGSLTAAPECRWNSTNLTGIPRGGWIPGAVILGNTWEHRHRHEYSRGAILEQIDAVSGGPTQYWY